MIHHHQGILEAATRLEPVVHRTAVARSRGLDRICGAQIFLKTENLQRTGSFKIRGAYNKLALCDVAARERGVVAYSSGNHAQGVALASSLLECRATIVAPRTILPTKRKATEAYGARIVTAGTTSEDREKKARALAAQEGWVLVPPYDDPDVIAGQGTVALEFLQDVPDLDCLVVPIGGGGLMSGCALAARALQPRIRLVGVEAEDAQDTYLSLRAGQRVRIPEPRTIADGIHALEPGELTFEVMQALVDEVVLVTDTEIVNAMCFLMERLKLVVEPTGAVGLAALLAAKVGTHGGSRVGVVLSGGNLDLSKLSGLLAFRRST